MPDARYPRRASSVSSFGDYSRSPSPTYSRSRSRSRSRPGRHASIPKASSRSRPQSRRTSPSRRDSVSSSRTSSNSPSRGGKTRRTKLKEEFKDKTTTTSGMKTSLVFLGSVAAATYAAHKFWPKGITYGEKEEWEIEKAVKKEKAKKSAEWDDSDRSDGPSRRGDSRSGVSDRRRDYDYDRPRSTQGRLGIQDVPRLHGDGPTPEVDRIVYATRPLRADRAQADGVTSMSVASGSRTGDVRRAQYVEDSRTIRPERSYAAVRERTDDDYRPAPRYVEYEARRYSLEEPSDPRRGERIVYARRDDGYR